jgi:hypothetical protein
VIVGKLLWACGFHVTDDHVVTFAPGDLVPAPDAVALDVFGDAHPLGRAELDELLRGTATTPDGRLRAMASRWLPDQESDGLATFDQGPQVLASRQCEQCHGVSGSDAVPGRIEALRGCDDLAPCRPSHRSCSSRSTRSAASQWPRLSRQRPVIGEQAWVGLAWSGSASARHLNCSYCRRR